MTTTPDRTRTERRPAAPERPQQATGPHTPEYDAAQGHTEPRNVLTIEIPGTVSIDLGPNGRVHHMAKYRLRKELEERAWLATMAALNNHNGPQPAIPLVMHTTVYWERGRRVWDDDNLTGAMKNARDSIAATMGIDDKHITTGKITQLRDPAGVGFVVVRLEHAT